MHDPCNYRSIRAKLHQHYLGCPKMNLTSAGTLPSLGAIALLSLGLSSCGMLGDRTAPRAQVTLGVADAAMSSGAPDLALRVADLVLAKQPDNPAALKARGDALYVMGQINLASQSYRAAVTLDPKLAEAQIGLGRTLIRSDPQAAEAAFLAAATLQPDNVVALSNLGVARDMQKHHTVAQQAYRAALALSPDMADVRVNLGLSLALSGQAEAAVQILRPLASEPGATQLWHADLAVALAQAGDLAGARHALISPGDTALAPDMASAGAPVAVPAPLVAVARRDMPAPAVARANTPPVTEALRISHKPAAPAADMVPNPMLAAMIAAAPAAAAEADAAPAQPAPAAAAPPDHPPTVPASVPTSVAVPANRATPTVSASVPVAVVARAAQAAASPAAAPIAANPPVVRSSAPMVVAMAAAPAWRSAAVPSVPAPAVVAGQPAPEPPVHAAASEAPAATHSGQTSWVQLAAVRSEQDVQFEWHRLQALLPDLLGGRSLTVTEGEVHEQTYWRLRTGGFASLADANALCLRIRLVGGKCLAVVTSGT